MYNLKAGFKILKQTKSKDEIEAFKTSMQRELNIGMVQMYRYISGTSEMKASQLFKVLDLFEKHGIKREELK